mmetsp:Transcript_26088/g.35611  ORF Transcript_26088/g.35611 Transcript_26088/m.35611 type:complete len:88 (-) Transcript_26088:962-1225(-)
MSFANAVYLENINEDKIYKPKIGPYFRAPETWDAKEQGYDYRADIYSVGILFYYICSGGSFPWIIPKDKSDEAAIKKFIMEQPLEFK